MGPDQRADRLLGSSTFIGFFFGALLAGTLGDLIGRRAVMMWALALYCVASLVSAWVDSWPPFFAARVIAGMGTGAESAIIAPYLAEFVARRFRGSFTGALAGFFSFGFVAAALLGYFIVPAHASGWRIVLVITALPVVMLLWWRRALPESPRWLESRGRTAEAEAVLDRIEADFRRRGATLAEPRPSPPAARPASGPISRCCCRPADAHHADDLDHVAVDHLQLLLVLRVDPGLLVESGMSMTKSFGYSLAIYCAQVPGYFSAAWFNEKIGRQATIASYMLLGGAGALGLALAKTDGQIMLAGIIMSFFMNGTYAGVYAYTAEVFPTAVHHRRGAGLGHRPAGRHRLARAGGLSVSQVWFPGRVRHHHGDAGAGRAGGAGDGRAHARPLAGSHRGGRGEMSGARPFRPAVAVLALNAVARAHEAPSQPQAVFAAVDHALAGEIGHRLFTILSYDPDSGVATRLYSNLPDAYPAGGSKTVMPGPWTDTVLARGECYIGYTPDDLRSVFADHELIASLDCQSVLNVPIRWRGRTWGSLNLLHAERWYGPDDAIACRPYAQLVLPALCCA